VAGATDYLEQKLLDHVFTDATYTPPTTLYLGLLSGTLTDDAGTGLTEQAIGTGAYARVATTAADWAAATGTAPATKATSTAKTFPTATADWRSAANITYVGLYDASTAGNLLWLFLLTTAKPVLSGDTPSIASGSLVVKLGDPGDTY
jgi:hypothetical protein